MTHLAQATPTPAAEPDEGQFLSEVRRGDALFLISKRFGVTVDQIKQADGLSRDLIRAGQTLKLLPRRLVRRRRPESGRCRRRKAKPSASA